MSIHPTEPEHPPADAAPEPVRADSVLERFDAHVRPTPLRLRTIGIVLLVSVVAALVMTATVLGLQLLALSLRAP